MSKVGQDFGDAFVRAAKGFTPVLDKLESMNLPKIAADFGSSLVSAGERFAAITQAAAAAFHFLNGGASDIIAHAFGGTGFTPPAKPADKPDNITVDGHTSMFKTDGMKFQTQGMQFQSPGMQFKNVYDETRGMGLAGVAGHHPDRYSGTSFTDEAAYMGLESGLHSGLGASLDAFGRATNSKRPYTGAQPMRACKVALGGGAYSTSLSGSTSALWGQLSGRVSGPAKDGVQKAIEDTNAKLDLLLQVWTTNGGSAGGGGSGATVTGK